MEAGIGRILSAGPTATRSVHVHGAWQPLDDEDFADDGNPKAGPWYQVRAGLRWSSSSSARRHLVTRFGGVWIHAGDDPNVVQEAGHYLGLYGSVGFQTDLTPTLSLGPELTVLGITRASRFSPARPVPQVSWHLRVQPRSRAGPLEGPPLRRGELYAGASAVVSPGFGGGILLGQVFRRGARATWSVEAAAALQPPRELLFFEQDGRWAQAQVGVRAALPSGDRARWAARGGAVWLRSTAANPFLDERADHVGGYLGVAYEHDLREGLATGPELGLLVVSYEQDVAFRLVPQLRWHLLARR